MVRFNFSSLGPIRRSWSSCEITNEAADRVKGGLDMHRMHHAPNIHEVQLFIQSARLGMNGNTGPVVDLALIV